MLAVCLCGRDLIMESLGISDLWSSLFHYEIKLTDPRLFIKNASWSQSQSMYELSLYFLLRGIDCSRIASRSSRSSSVGRFRRSAPYVLFAHRRAITVIKCRTKIHSSIFAVDARKSSVYKSIMSNSFTRYRKYRTEEAHFAWIQWRVLSPIAPILPFRWSATTDRA